jgi:hypothetical protein
MPTPARFKAWRRPRQPIPKPIMPTPFPDHLDTANAILAEEGVRVVDDEWHDDARREGHIGAMPRELDVDDVKVIIRRLNESSELIASLESWINEHGRQVLAVWIAPAGR